MNLKKVLIVSNICFAVLGLLFLLPLLFFILLIMSCIFVLPLCVTETSFSSFINEVYQSLDFFMFPAVLSSILFIITSILILLMHYKEKKEKGYVKINKYLYIIITFFGFSTGLHRLIIFDFKGFLLYLLFDFIFFPVNFFLMIYDVIKIFKMSTDEHNNLTFY